MFENNSVNQFIIVNEAKGIDFLRMRTYEIRKMTTN